MDSEFLIVDWSAWAPGLETREQWLRWAVRPGLPLGQECPALPEMAVMQRRRLDPLGRMAAQVVYRCQQDRVGIPTVFASRYGEPSRSLEMLGHLAHGEPLSPTTFGLSVHNAIGAMVAIARRDRANSTAIAAGASTPAAALIEARALLVDGAPEVLVVCHDAPLPGPYAGFEDGPAACWAWAWRVAAPAAGDRRFRLHCDDTARAPDDAAELPFGLDLLHAILAPGATRERRVDGRRWIWGHDA